MTDDFDATFDPDDDGRLSRRLELLVDLALQGLPPEELTELESLGAAEADALPFILAAAAAELAIAPAENAPLPPHLVPRIEAEADAFLDRRFGRNPGRIVRMGNAFHWLGWVAAAASLLFVFSSRRESTRPSVSSPGPSLIERLAGLPRLRLNASEHPLARGSGGELVWSGERQEGFMAIRGLAEVEPTRGVYQLWIFDDARDERFPVDGGMFTVGDAKATTIVPIHASLPVRRPTLFAITLEPPGGVVVSDRKRILLTASNNP